MFIANSSTYNSEDAIGAAEKRGGRKTSRRTPLPKLILNPPSSGTFFYPHPSSGVVAAVFPVQKSKFKLSTSEALLEGSENVSGGCVVEYAVPSPHTFLHPPPYHVPKYNSDFPSHRASAGMATLRICICLGGRKTGRTNHQLCHALSEKD